VCKLHKAIYGLKQALRAWFTRFFSFLLDIGFQASLVDFSLFLFFHGNMKLFMLVYVDDIIVTGIDYAYNHSLILRLQQEFPLKDLGPLGFFLGIQASHTSVGLHLYQAKYINDLLTHVHMLGAKPSKSPCSFGSKLSQFDGVALDDSSEYRHVVGSLQYCTLTRPDIAFSMNQLCQHLHHPNSIHFAAAKRVLRYLKNNPDHGLFYTKGPLHLTAYCDSDWGGNPNDRRSTSGFAVFLGNSLVSWNAKKQAVVSRSSTEAEYRSLAITVAEIYWLCMLFCDIQVPLPASPVL
jgi:hypothetical protein